jgi:hypothetical protein
VQQKVHVEQPACDYLKLQIEQIEALAANLVQVGRNCQILASCISDDKVAFPASTTLATQARIGYLLSNYRNMKGLVSIDLFSLEWQALPRGRFADRCGRAVRLA